MKQGLTRFGSDPRSRKAVFFTVLRETVTPVIKEVIQGQQTHGEL